MKRLAGATLLAVLLALVVYMLVIRRWLLEWGTSVAERERRLIGDDVVPSPKYETTHAITIDAPVEDVWPWLVQLGQGRGGFYTYDWLENVFQLDMHSADRILPEHQSLEVGDIVSLAPDEGMPMWVVEMDPGRAFVLSTGRPGSRPEPGDYLKGELAGSWAFVLEPVDPTRTRFLVRWRSDWQESPLSTVLNTAGLEPAHCIMERGMMLGIKQRVEGSRGVDLSESSATAA